MKVKELLAKPEHWTQKTFARTASGGVCNFRQPEAFSFCFIGAIYKCYPEIIAPIIIKRVRDHLLGNSISAWNDYTSRTHQDVLDLAIKLDI